MWEGVRDGPVIEVAYTGGGLHECKLGTDAQQRFEEIAHEAPIFHSRFVLHLVQILANKKSGFAPHQTSE
jgi:hypothetical protein